jgi:hypothetical protein
LVGSVLRVEAVEASCEWRLLGSLVCECGAVRGEELLEALAHQKQSGGLLGEILLDWGYVSRPFLTRLLAEQRGVCLEQETGFGTGLRAAIERRAREWSRMKLVAAADAQPADGDCGP